MDKEVGKITFIKTDDGFRIEGTGKELFDAFPCCCGPIFAGGVKASECCPPEEEKKK